MEGTAVPALHSRASAVRPVAVGCGAAVGAAGEGNANAADAAGAAEEAADGAGRVCADGAALLRLCPRADCAAAASTPSPTGLTAQNHLSAAAAAPHPPQ